MGSLAACTSSHQSTAPRQRDFFPVPAAATAMPLGAVPAGPCPASASPTCQGQPGGDIVKGDYPMDVPGLGIPVGGVGAGSFMVNQAGTFGPWDFGGSQDSAWEMRVLPQAAFHFREQVGSAAPLVRTLATDGPSVKGTDGPVPGRSWGSPLPAWNVLQPGQGTYSALDPFGWISYQPFQTDVSMRFFSPLVADQDKPTSLPVVYFDVRLANHTGKRDSVSVMFTMPNAPDHTSGTPVSVREGFTSRLTADPATGVKGVTLSADSPNNTPDAANSEWTIAAQPGAGQSFSYTTSWNANGTGADVYAPFSSSGRLPDQPLDSSSSAGAVAVSAVLQPGQVTTIPFALTWDFPQVGFDKNQTVWMRRYTNFYGAKETAANAYVPDSYPFHQSFRIADDALAGQNATLRAVQAWWEPIADNPAYPLVLRTAALNQLYQLAFNNSFWEGGLVSNSVAPTDGAPIGADIPGLHVFDNVDSTAPTGADTSSTLNSSNEMDVDSYNYLVYDRLFPNLERDRTLALAEAIMLDSHGDAGHDPLYVPSADPLMTAEKSGAPVPGATSFIDIPSLAIFRMYAYAHLADDPSVLRAVYPAMLKSLSYLDATIAAGHHLPSPSRNGANTYDIIPVNGYDVYDSELYLLSLETVIAAGRQLGQPASNIATWSSQLAAAKAEFEKTFWDPAHGFYRYTPGPTPSADSVLLGTFFAQSLAEQVGLPDLVDPAHYRTQLVGEYSQFMSRRDGQGRLIGAPNMILPPGQTTWPLVGALGPYEETEVWAGSDFNAAATYYQAGARFGDPDLERDGIAMASAVATQIWDVPSNGFRFDAPEAWNEATTTLYRYPVYARPLAVWDVLNAIRPLKA
jgi:uncharacterized protein (DUF608 family)